ncbi:MAG: PH domain-containing protein [Clostridium sp.]|uniref:PH domain-containing protein n=1 Tax=Clostridium sp. TaxID=1506 RepID=UPI003D6C7E37
MRELIHPHKFTIFSEIFKSLKDSMFPLIIFLVSLGSKIPKKYGGNYTEILIVIIFLILIVVLSILRWMKNEYSFNNEGIYLKYGVFEVHERTLPFSQVHSADISSSLVQRIFNVCKLEIDTLGGDKKSEISILLSKDEALRVKEVIFNASKEKNKVEIAQKDNTRKFTCSLKDLFVMATMSTKIIAGFFIMFAFYSKIEDILPDELKNWAESSINDSVKDVSRVDIIKYIVILILIILLISWIISVLITVIKYYKFEVVREEDNIKLSYGLLDKKEVTIPVKRIQSITIVEGLIKKSFGYFSLNVETIGYGKDKGESTMICPIAKKKILNKFFEDIIPEMNITYDLMKSPRRALKGFLLVNLIGYIIAIALIVKFAPYGYYVFILLPIIVIWQYIQFGDNGMYTGDDLVVLRYRKLSRETVIVQRECVQSMEKIQNIFQKKKSIAKFKVTIAGDIVGKSYQVGYMDENYINKNYIDIRDIN